MKVHITNIYGQSSESTALIAQNMVQNIASELGFKEIGIYNYPIYTDSKSELDKRIDGMLASVSSEDIVIVQFPTWNTMKFDSILIDKLLTYDNIKVAIFIQDVVPLMFENNYYLMPKFIDICNRSNILIVPTRSMLERLKLEGLRGDKVVLQELWDHLTDTEYQEPKFERVLKFAGSPSRFPFVKTWNFDTKLQVFADGDSTKLPKNVTYQGWLTDTEMILRLSSGFGLVWSEETTNQKERTYSQYNLSYKLSTYLAAGLPVIVNKKISTEDFIIANGIGKVASSLDQVDEIVQGVTRDEYYKIAENVKKMSYLVKNGYFTKRLLVETVCKLLTK